MTRCQPGGARLAGSTAHAKMPPLYSSCKALNAKYPWRGEERTRGITPGAQSDEHQEHAVSDWRGERGRPGWCVLRARARARKGLRESIVVPSAARPRDARTRGGGSPSWAFLPRVSSGCPTVSKCKARFPDGGDSITPGGGKGNAALAVRDHALFIPGSQEVLWGRRDFFAAWNVTVAEGDRAFLISKRQ